MFATAVPSYIVTIRVTVIESPNAPLITFFFFQFVPFPSLTEISILQGPVSQLVPLNSKATFFCRASGDLVIWYINGDPVDYRNGGNGGSLRQRGFTFIDINVPPEVNKTMSVTASLQNNNTNISCGSTLRQGEQSATASLLVAGKQSILVAGIAVMQLNECAALILNLYCI